MTDIYGQKIQLVTIRMLLAMRSGLKDYDNNKIWELTLAGINNNNADITPFDYLNMVDQSA